VGSGPGEKKFYRPPGRADRLDTKSESLIHKCRATWGWSETFNMYSGQKLFLPRNTGTAVAQWLRCCATDRKVAGPIPAGVSGFFIDIFLPIAL